MIADKIALINKYGFNKSNTLESYLKSRYASIQKKKTFNVVYDLLHQCDICCLGCGTNASWTNDTSVSCTEMSLNQIERVLIKIKDYSTRIGLTPFINYGGGEPFLREDIISILKLSAEILGADNIGIDTNASLEKSYEMIHDIVPYVSYIGISINGLEDYHNWWSNNRNINAYANATSVLKKLCVDQSIASKIEVTSVATKKNCDSIPELMDALKKMGVVNYSVHRAIPVGRMQTIGESLIPDADKYLGLLIDVISAAERLSINAHFHHSIEAIYASLLFGINTYDAEKVINANYRSSISIDPLGEVLIDPWCTVGIWRKLSLGNVFDYDFTFEKAFNNKTDILNKVRMSIEKENRCYGCKRHCSGGSRIVAAVNKINEVGVAIGDVNQLFDALKAIDPACPLAYSDDRSDEV